MLEQSMLAKDRRRESGLILLMCFLVLAQLGVQVFLPDHVQLLVLLNLLIGSLSLLFLVVWYVVRVARLRAVRPFKFHAGMTSWVVISVISALLSIRWWSVGVFHFSYSLIVIFIGVVCFYTVMAKWRNWHFLRELGWPMFKPFHFISALIVLCLSFSGLLSWDQEIALSGFLLFLAFRYGFNRWIYARSVHYPFRKTAAKFYINKMRRSPERPEVSHKL